jgi:hypothetical protein
MTAMSLGFEFFDQTSGRRSLALLALAALGLLAALPAAKRDA